ncbi:MAG: hypothetical protein AB7U52_03570 [Candidatus Izemoplasmatales bacterium]
MKKIVLGTILLLSALSIFIIRVNAYSPDYLPGGKNYISSDNIIKVDEIISTMNPFLVIPYTEYTFSVSTDYVDGRAFIGSISFYDNDSYLSELSFDDSMMDFDNEFFSASLTFTVPTEANYLSFEFRDNGSYVSGTELIGVQLEEGNVMTAYEPYLQGSIIDTSSPYFIGSGTIISYFDQPITIAEIQSSLSAYDDIDGDLTANIIVYEDNYSTNTSVLGTYQVIFQVSDNSNNSTQITINVEVVDVLPPVFSVIGAVTAVYPNIYTVAEIISMLSASDNYDGEVSSSISLVEDNYTLNASNTGSYQMDFMVSDSSGNIAYYTQDIIVVDNQGPVISGIDQINIGYNQILSVDNVKSNLNVVDNYDDSSILNIVLDSDNYTINRSKLGVYTMQFSVTDSSGNKTTKIVTINVIDAIGPMVYLDSSIIQVYSNTVLALPDFAKLLVKTNELDKTQDYLISIRYDSYSKFANVPGTYHMYLDFEDGYGKITSKDFQIRVIDKSYDDVYIHEDVINLPSTTLKPGLIFAISGAGLVTLGSVGFVVIKLIKRRPII